MPLPLASFAQMILLSTVVGILIARHTSRTTFYRVAVALTALSCVPDVACGDGAVSTGPGSVVHRGRGALIIVPRIARPFDARDRAPDVTRPGAVMCTTDPDLPRHRPARGRLNRRPSSSVRRVEVRNMAENPTALMQQLHDEHAAALWGFCLHLTSDPVRAEDVAQETLLRAWQHYEVLDEARGSVRSWLFTVARNIVIDEWRSKRSQNERRSTRCPSPATRSTRPTALLQSWVVAEAITQLSPEHRAVLMECYYRGRSVAEASRRLGVPEGTVKSRTHYALRALRLALEEMGVGA